MSRRRAIARNGSGVYSLPAGSTVANGDTSDATDLNTPLSDLETDANTARPIVAGGTGETTAKAARSAFLFKKGADVASNTALTLGADGNYFDVTGTTTITSINTWNVGDVVVLQFDGALTLTHHATNLILPGGADITTAAGDQAAFVEYASGNWRCLWYTNASQAADLSTVYQPLDATLTAFAGGLTDANKIPYATATDTLGELDFLDEDDMASDSATGLISQQSAVAYFAQKAGDGGSISLSGAGPIDLSTAIPAGVNKLIIGIRSGSLSGNDNILIQLSSSTFATSGYQSTSNGTDNGSGLIVLVGNASYSVQATMMLIREPGTNSWEASHSGRIATGVDVNGGGAITLAGELDGVRIGVTGSNTFDAGAAWVRWEY